MNDADTLKEFIQILTKYPDIKFFKVLHEAMCYKSINVDSLVKMNNKELYVLMMEYLENQEKIG